MPGGSNFVAPSEASVGWSDGSHWMPCVRFSPFGNVTVNVGV